MSEKARDIFGARTTFDTGSGTGYYYRLHKLAQYVRGWMGYFGISDYYRPIPELDQGLRRRLRMCCWKQWRHPPSHGKSCTERAIRQIFAALLHLRGWLTAQW